MTATSLTFTKALAASPANVWRCLTEPALIEQWFAPKPVVTSGVVMEPYPGGMFSNTMDVPGHGKMSGEGCVLVADPQKRLVWTSTMKGGFVPNMMDEAAGAFPFTADIRLEKVADGCTYHVTVLHKDAADSAKHEQMGFYMGWGTAADQLGALAATL